jgi:hypothetical protein
MHVDIVLPVLCSLEGQDNADNERCADHGFILVLVCGDAATGLGSGLDTHLPMGLLRLPAVQ